MVFAFIAAFGGVDCVEEVGVVDVHFVGVDSNDGSILFV